MMLDLDPLTMRRPGEPLGLHRSILEEAVLRIDGRDPEAVRAIRGRYPTLAHLPIEGDIAAALQLFLAHLDLGSRLPAIRPADIAPALRKAADAVDAALVERNA